MVAAVAVEKYPMRAIRLPNGNLLIPVESRDGGDDVGLAEIGSDDPRYDKWLPFAEDGEDARLGAPVDLR